MIVWMRRHHRRFARVGLGLWAGGLLLHAAAVIAQPAAGTRTVITGEIRGSINPASADFLKTAIALAERESAEALILELDTPGGLVTSTREMAQAIDGSRVPVVIHVTPAGSSATSAGALLALASHVAAMAPGTNIGAAHPVDSGGKDVPGAMGEKVTNDTAAFARGLAELRGRNRELAEQVVRKSRSLTAQEALKEGMIELIAPSRDDLLRALEGRVVTLRTAAAGAKGGATGGDAERRTLRVEGARVVPVAMSRAQRLLHYLADPNIATILMTLGSLLIYVEISNPGITIAGVLGLTCLLLGFISFQVLPIRVGAMALVALGIGLMIAELFVATSGALAVGGVLSFALGLLWLLDPAQTDLRIAPLVWVPAVVGLGTGALGLSWAAARTRKLAREARERIGGSADEGLHGYPARVLAPAAPGRPGRARIRGEIWSFTSDEPLAAGEEARVLGVDGMIARLGRAKR